MKKNLAFESLTNFLKGGKGDNTDPNDLNQEQLNIGIEVEKEHSNDIKTRKKIAVDHLTEKPNYYTKLIKAGLVDEPNAIKKYNKIK